METIQRAINNEKLSKDEDLHKITQISIKRVASQMTI